MFLSETDVSHLGQALCPRRHKDAEGEGHDRNRRCFELLSSAADLCLEIQRFLQETQAGCANGERGRRGLEPAPLLLPAGSQHFPFQPASRHGEPEASPEERAGEEEEKKRSNTPPPPPEPLRIPRTQTPRGDADGRDSSLRGRGGLGGPAPPLKAPQDSGRSSPSPLPPGVRPLPAIPAAGRAAPRSAPRAAPPPVSPPRQVCLKSSPHPTAPSFPSFLPPSLSPSLLQPAGREPPNP